MFRSTTLRTTSRSILAVRHVPSTPRAFISSTTVLSDQEAAQEDIRSRLKTALKTAMKAKEKDTAGTIRVSAQTRLPLSASSADPLDRL